MVLPKGDGYYAEVKIQFDLKNLPQEGRPLVIEYSGKEIYDLKVNGDFVIDDQNHRVFENQKIRLQNVKVGLNIVTISMYKNYNTVQGKDGMGL